MEPYYSIQEIADILDKDVASVCNGLIACGVISYFNGEKVNLPDYDSFFPQYTDQTFVITGGKIRPNPNNTYVSTEALSAVWVQSIKEAKSHDDENDGEFKQTPAGDSEGGEKSPHVADRAHVSNQLAILNQAASRFWANADKNDRSTHPIKPAVIEWLIQHGFNRTLAVHAATIIRPEWAGKGRKPEE